MIEEVNISEGYYHNIRAFLEIPKGEGPFPTIIICHGLTANPATPVDSHIIYRRISNHLANLGFLTVRFNFTMEMEKDIATFHLKSEEHDLKKVIEFLLRDEKVDKKRIGAVGHSYGATILLLIAHENSHISAVSALAPRINLEEEYNKDHPQHQEAQEKGYFTHTDNESKIWKISKFFFEENFSQHTRLQRSIKKLSVPLLLIYGTGDKKDAEEGEEVQRLVKHVEVIKIDKANHEFTNVPWGLEEATTEVGKFFLNHIAHKC